MLGGLDPVIVFTLFKSFDLPFVDGVKIPLIPIPVYLSEDIFKVAVGDYSKSVIVDARYINNQFSERVARTDISLSLQCTRDNLVATALSALFDTCIKMVAKQDYVVSLFYDDIILVNGAISSFSSMPISDTNMRVLNFSLCDRGAGEATIEDLEQAVDDAAIPELVVPISGTPAGI